MHRRCAVEDLRSGADAVPYKILSQPPLGAKGLDEGCLQEIQQASREMLSPKLIPDQAIPGYVQTVGRPLDGVIRQHIKARRLVSGKRNTFHSSMSVLHHCRPLSMGSYLA
jgi:hypothetical protein